VARRLGPKSQIALFCVDAQIFAELAEQAFLVGNREKTLLCIELARTAAFLAAGKVEGLNDA